jgi:molybdate transport system ATP-binding protein
MKPQPLITLENTSVRLRERPYLQNTSWQINSKENWAILGPNGSGKTTFAKSLFGGVPIVKGRIKFHFSKRERQNPATITQAIGYVSPELQRDIIDREALKDHFRDFSGKTDDVTKAKHLILDTMIKPAGAVGDENKLDQIVEKIGIEDLLERDVKSLSTGEMNTVLIASALMKRPKLLILDEPFEGLDQPSRNSLANTINDLTRTHIQLILITHRFEEIISNITHVLLLKQGQIYKAGRKEDVFTPNNIKRAYEMDRHANLRDPHELLNALPALKPIRPPLNQDKKTAEARILIEMKNVTVKYNRQRILDRINWVVRDGENWMITGPKGAGKSTVLTLIRGDNLQAYANEIYLFGKKRGSGESIWDIRKRLGYIASNLQLRQRKNTGAFDVVCSGFFDSNGLYRRCSSDELSIARQWIHFLDIADLADQKFGRLSHGQRQLVLIARAMVKSPEFLILDAPFQGLDIKNKSKLEGILETIGAHTHTNLIYVPDRDAENLNCMTHELKMERGKVTHRHTLRT